jgi:hypothetical protein
LVIKIIGSEDTKLVLYMERASEGDKEKRMGRGRVKGRGGEGIRAGGGEGRLSISSCKV